MENKNNAAEANHFSGEDKTTTTPEEQNPSNSNINNGGNDDNSNNDSEAQGGANGRGSRRTPFTDLSQVDADLALARTLQEQERAYMMLSMNADGIHYGSWEAAHFVHDDGEDEDFDVPSDEEYGGTDVDDDDDEEDVFDVHAHAEAREEEHGGLVLDPSAYSSDEAYARALQDAEEREMAARLLSLTGINEEFVGDADDDDDDHGGNSQVHSESAAIRIGKLRDPFGTVNLEVKYVYIMEEDAWEDVDPDEMSYEELIALGEVVGTESRGLSADTIGSLPSMNYKSQTSHDASIDPCVICRSDFEDGETLTVLSCKHSYHSECINNWLRQNKVCPICNAEVSTSRNS